MRTVLNKRSRHGSTKPFVPTVGAEFDVEEAPVIEAQTRGILARAIVGLTGIAVAVTGLYGLVTANFVPVEVVWAVVGPLIGAMVTYYFGLRKDTG